MGAKGTNGKRVATIVIIVVVAVAAILAIPRFVFGVRYADLFGGGGASSERVYVESVSTITNAGATGVQNRFTGVIEPQESLDVQRAPDRTVREIFVRVGDVIEQGADLFEYDTADIQNQIDQARLALEEMDNQIRDFNTQITQLTEDRDEAPEDQKFQYTTQIQAVQVSIRQTEFNKRSKQVEIDRMRQSLEGAVVVSEMGGLITAINESGNDPMTGQALPFISILSQGDFRVRGLVNEQNVWNIQPGMGVIIRSRLDEAVTWMGSVSEVDTNPDAGNNNNIWGGPSLDTASRYPFYVTLDVTEGLMLGQHVFIELNNGQAAPRTGIWLFESYITIEDNGTAFVWADNGRGRLERRTVELGEHDAGLGLYEITSGLSTSDLITFPMPNLTEGMATTTDMSQAGGGEGIIVDPGVASPDGGFEVEPGVVPDGGFEVGPGGAVPDGGFETVEPGDGGFMIEGEPGDGGMVIEGEPTEDQPQVAEPEVAR